MAVKNIEQKTLFDQIADERKDNVSVEFKNDRTIIKGDLPPDVEIPDNSNVLLIGNDQSYATHGLHKYPAKFIPEFPRWAIQKYSNKGDTVLDPFSGSGTTAVESVMNQRKSLSVDIDPLALLLTRVKTTAFDPDRLREAHRELVSRIKTGNQAPNQIPEFKNRDHWFKPEITEKLSYIKEEIEKEENKNIQQFFQVTMSSIVRSVSNADPGSHKPCVRKGMNRRLADPIEKFLKKLSKNVESAIQFFQETNGEPDSTIIGKDARKINTETKSVDLAVTSPPYINALDYARTHKLEYYWLGFFNDSLVDLKKKFVGTEQVYADDYRELHEFGHEKLDSLLASIYENDQKRSYIVYKFFVDMKENLREIKRILKRRGQYVMFVGNNQIANHTVENWKFLIDIAEDLGFEMDSHWESGVINHYIKFERDEQIDTDHVLIFKKK